LPEITVTARDHLLVYVPFVSGHHDLTQPALKVSVQKNQLALASHL
jgi:hypothetical protein